MKLMLRVNEINMALVELRLDRPPPPSSPRYRTCRGKGGQNGLQVDFVCKEEYCDQHIASSGDAWRFGASHMPRMLESKA